MTTSPYSWLDRPEVLGMVFYPRHDPSPPPPGAEDHLVPVAPGVAVSLRCYLQEKAAASLLLFHGNGEVAADYDGIAPFYWRLGIELWVADYRGYGRSNGTPSFSAMMADAHAIFRYWQQALPSRGLGLAGFIMGRSLGTYSALELAMSYPERLRGLIIESGSANPLRLLRFLGIPLEPPQLQEMEGARLARLGSLKVPLLVIHGERDSLVPLGEAVDLYQRAASPRKELVVIPGAGHNDLLFLGLELYFSALGQFIQDGGEEPPPASPG